MLVVCRWYHREARILGEEPGEGITHRLCPECSSRLRREVEEVGRRIETDPVLRGLRRVNGERND